MKIIPAQGRASALARASSAGEPANDPQGTTAANTTMHTATSGLSIIYLRAAHIPAAGRKPPVWRALDESRSVAVFAGIWTRWTSVRKVKEGETTNDLFAFLTTEPNAEVGAIHPKETSAKRASSVLIG